MTKRANADAELDATPPLQALYDALQAALAGTTLNLYPGAISAGSGPLAAALDLVAAAGLNVTGATLTPWPATTIVVTGTTSSFAGNAFALTATFTLDTDQKTVIMSMSMSADALTFASAPWFTIDDPQLVVTSSPVSGALTGTITFTDNTTNPATKTIADISATLPPDHVAVFSTAFSGNAPSIQTIFQYVGGFNLIASLPPPLNVIAALTLNSVDFTYDFNTSTLTQFTVDLTTTPATPWNVIGKLTFTTMHIVFAVNGPTGARTVSWTATPQIAIGTGNNPGTIDVTVSYPPFTVAAALDPVSTPPNPANPLLLADVVSFFLPDSVAPPIGGEVSALSMTTTPGSGVTSTTYEIAAAVSGDWSIPSSAPIFTVTSLGFAIDGTKKPVTGSVTGSITFFESQPTLEFVLVVSAAYDGSAWTISGTQQPDTTINVSDIIKTYVGSGWWTDALPDFAIQDFAATIVTGANGTYTVAATVPTFTLPFGIATLTNVVGSFGNTIPSTTGSGSASITADAHWFGIDLQFALVYAPGKSSYSMTWPGHATVTLAQTPNWVATIAFTGDETLGDIVQTFVKWATGYAYGLAAPWSLLNDISLSGSSIAYDFTAKTVTFTVGIGLNLGFCKIDSAGLTYNTQATGDDSSVSFQLNGTFPWITSTTKDGDSPSQISWDATKPETTKQPPGNGNEYIDLRLLALGQHVTVPNITSATTVQQAIADLAAMPNNSDADSDSSTQQLLPPVAYDAGSDWLIGTDFGLLKLPADDPSGASYAATLQIVFLDPTFYALRIALDGGPAKILGGLDFEIIYRKISDTIGVYQAEITLPTAMRTIQTGVFTIMLPTFGIEVFTNGDFQIDFGFPWNNDFSRSFTVQAQVGPFPLTGSAGFYFGKLSSATTNKVPAVSNGTFNPVIVFGFGVQAGFGKSVSIGPLSASFSLTVLAIIEGVIAKWNPFLPAHQGDTSTSQLDGTYYYSLTGTFGVAGMLNGSVDFAIVKASVSISIVITAQITFTSYAPVVITVSASVDASASISIDCGLFSITLHFSFSLDVHETFTIGSQGTAPWTPVSAAPAGVLGAPLARRLTSLRRADPLLLAAATAGWNDTPTWGVLSKDPAAPLLPLTAYLSFALTASGDGAQTAADQQVCFVAMLALDAGTPLSTAAPVPACIASGDTSFDALAKLVTRWTVAAFWQTTSAQPNLTCDQLDAIVVTDDVLATIVTYLADEDGTTPVPMPTATIETMLAQQVALTLWGPGDVASGATVQAAFFPMPVELSLTTPAYGGATAYDYTFAGFNTLAAGGLGILRTYFDQLAVQTKKEAARSAALDSAPTSVADFVFGDYFLLIARQMIAALRDGLRDFKYQVLGGDTPQAIVDTVNATTEQFTVADLFAVNDGVALGTGKPMTIAGSTAAVAANDTFASIAARTVYGGAFTATDLASANLLNTALLQPLQSVTYATTGETIVVNAGDSLTTLAARFTTAPVPSAQQLAADTGIQGQAKLLIPFAAIQLPPLPYTTGASDTPATVAAKFGVTAASLGAPSSTGTANPNATVADLFAPSSGLLDMPHLLQNTVGALIDEAQRTGATTRLSGMISRYHLHGLRLPTVQNGTPIVTPNTAGMWVTDDNGTLTLPPTAGLYALTGQQFPIPPITTAAGSFAITVGGASAPSWLAFKNGTTSIVATIAPAPTPTGDMPAAPIEALRTLVTAPNYRFVSGYTELGAQSQLVRAPASYALGTYANWLSAALPQLPYGAPADGAVPRIWAFPTSLSSLLDQPGAAVLPTFMLQTQTYDEALRETVAADVVNYGWASRLSFTIKQVPAVAGATASAQTYEVIGADATDIVLLEDLVSQFTDDTSIEGLWLAFAPDPSLQTAGLQSGSAAAAYGIGQANLSTVTRPPGAGAAFAMMLDEDAVAAGPVALNGNAMFLRLLWEASITAQGGFYLYYDDAGAPLPDHLFNKDGEASLTVLVVYAASLNDQLYDCMNAVAITDPFDPSKSALVAVAAPVATSAAFTSSAQTLAQFAASYFADVADLANDNADLALTANAAIAVNDGTYLVSPLGTNPGDTPATIAAWFGTDAATLLAANPRIASWPATLPAYTALRLPPLTIAAGVTMNDVTLNTLGAVAAYFGADVVGLAVDNQNVAGLFTAALQVAGGPVTRASKLPPGSQLIALQRAVPAPIPPSSDPGYPALLMSNQFSLLGYQVAPNQDFAASAMGVPVGPTGAGGSGSGKLRVPNALAAGDTWTFDVTLAYGSLISPPPSTPNPYDAVGRLLQVDFDWRDLYGNTIISDLSSPQAGDPGTLNLAPQLLGYTDALVGLGQWPSANAQWSISGTGAAELDLAFSFDDTRYTANGAQTNAANAASDAVTYQQLAYQLADPNGTAFTVQTSLANAPLPVADTNLSDLTAWLAAILAYLNAVAAGQTAAAPQPQPLAFPLAAGTINTAQLFELDCTFTFARTGGVVEGEFETVAGVRSVTTSLAPSGASTASGLTAFATSFESAFLQTGSFMLKVAAGPDRYQGGAATSSTLWAVRIGLASGQAMSYAVDTSDAPLIFAPKPISNQLVSNAAPIYGYVSGTGIDFNQSNPPSQSFANVDLDVWARAIFAAVDELLSPEYISALVILDEKTFGPNPAPGTMTHLAALTRNKAALAAMYAQQMDAVFKDQAGADNTAVAAAFEQSMLEQLANAYETQAALQYAVDVVADVDEPAPTNETPNYYGPVLQTGTPNPGIALTSTKIPLATATDVPLAFLVTTPSQTGGDVEDAFVSLNLVYAPSNVEHQRETVPQIPGNYVASSWLQFVIAPPGNPADPLSIARALGSVNVPMVLRTYPSNPAMASQTGAQTYADGTLPAGGITQATQWTYAFTYALPGYYPQDTIYGTVAFNIAEAQPDLLAASFADAFPWLAEFVTVYPSVVPDLRSKVATITPATTGAQLQIANTAIGSVNAMLGKITGVSVTDAREHVPVRRFALRPRTRGLFSATDVPWTFTLSEAQYQDLTPPPKIALPTGSLVITVKSTADGAPVPAVQLAGYTANDAAGTPVQGATTVQYYFTGGNGAVLTADAAQPLARTLQYPGLQILDKQDAQVSVHVTRNEHLITGRTTNPDFVYRTADVTFTGPLLPSNFYTQPIAIPAVDPSGPRSLTQQLTTLFAALTSTASGSSMSLQLTVAYQYTLNPGATGTVLPVTVPVLMQPPLSVFWGSGTPPDGDVLLSDMIADVAGAIAAWFTANVPSSAGGVLLFSLTVMTSLTTLPTPLLRLSDLQLPLSAINPPLQTATLSARP